VRKLLPALIAAACIHAAPLSAQVTGTRSFTGACAADQLIDVELDVDVGAQTPNGVIVVEKLPVGWVLNTATPLPSNINIINGEVRWVFFGAGVNDEDLDIRYSASSAGPAQAEIAGDLRYNDPAGEPQIVPIGGETMCAPPVCVGDCDGDRAVTINEVLQCIDIILGNSIVGSGCAACDPDGSGSTTVDELVTGVNHALNGCDQ
jgi:hypothetical protein